MSKRDLSLVINDMLEAANKILTVDAVIRNFEVIGEAANNFDDDFRNSNPNIH